MYNRLCSLLVKTVFCVGCLLVGIWIYSFLWNRSTLVLIDWPMAISFRILRVVWKRTETVRKCSRHISKCATDHLCISIIQSGWMDDDYDFGILWSRLSHCSNLSLSPSLPVSLPVSLWDVPLILMTIKPFFQLTDALISSFRPLTYFVFGGSSPYAYAIIEHGCALSMLDVYVRVSSSSAERLLPL